MKRAVLIFLTAVLTVLSGCVEKPPAPVEQTSVNPAETSATSELSPVIAYTSVTTVPPEPIPEEIAVSETTAETEPPAEVYTDSNNVEYTLISDAEHNMRCTLNVSGTSYNVDFTYVSYLSDTHFYLDGKTLYAVCTASVSDYGNESNLHELYSGTLSADESIIKMKLLESHTEKDIIGMTDMYKRLNEISPLWSNPEKKRMDFIACGSFINENCYYMTDEEYNLIHTQYWDIYYPEKTDEEEERLVSAINAAQKKADEIYDSYTLFITPENINELSKFDGAAVRNLHCYLSEDGLDLSPLTKIKTYMWSGYSYNDTTVISVSGTPKPSDFIGMVDSVENFNGRISYWRESPVSFKNCDIIADIDELPRCLYMRNCNITAEKPFAGNIHGVYFKDCRFDKIPDFSGLKITIYAPNPYRTDNEAEFTFDCPRQKAVGFEKMQFEADTEIYLNGDIDIPNFDFLKNAIYDHAITIQTTGNINVDDLIQNDCNFKSISFIDCITKKQYDLLNEKYPEKISARIDGVEYRS